MNANTKTSLAVIDRGYQGDLIYGDYLLEKELIYKLAGAAMAVLNELGHGLREKTYERALVLELRHFGIRSDFQLQTPQTPVGKNRSGEKSLAFICVH